MADSEKTSAELKCCSVCGTSSAERVILSGEQKGEEMNVCVRCLPVLIHGGH